MPEKGEERYVTKFLWWPKTINGETRWLRKATWREVFLSSLIFNPLSDKVESVLYGKDGEWEAVEWVDDELIDPVLA